MIKLKAKEKKKAYKTTDAWLDAVYENNQSLLESRIEEASNKATTKKDTFKQMVKEYMEEGLSPTKAVQALSRSENIRTTGERLIDNAWAGLKADKSAWNLFRNLNKNAKQQYQAINPALMKYNKADKNYIYNGMIVVSFLTSPEQITVTKIGG